MLKISTLYRLTKIGEEVVIVKMYEMIRLC